MCHQELASRSSLLARPRSAAQEERGQRERAEVQQYGGAALNTVKENKALKEENTKLKKLVADLSLDKVALKELLEGKW